MSNLSTECDLRNKELAIQATRLGEFSEQAKNEFYRKVIARGEKADSASGIGLDLMINGMLSGFGTPTVNVVSMLIQSIMKPTIESIGLITDSIHLTKGGREWNQVAAMWQASVDSFAQDAVYFREGFRKGYSLERDINLRQLGMNKKDFQTFLKEDMGVDNPKDLNIEQVEDIMLDMQDYMHNTIGHTKFGKAFGGRGETLVRWPTKLIVGIDEYGKARFRRQSMFQMAAKFAKEDSKLGIKTKDILEYDAKGKVVLDVNGKEVIKTIGGDGSYEGLYKRYKEELFTDANSDLMWDTRLKQFVAQRRTDQSVKTGKDYEGGQGALDKEARLAISLTRDDALFNAFQQRLAGTPRKIQQLRHDHPAFALFVPFIKTPWNIIKEGYNYLPIIPTLRASINTKEGVKKVLFDLRSNKIPLHGPVEKMSYDELIPRQIIGMTMFATIGTMFDTDTITGSMPRSPSERQRWQDAGIKPYSIRIGDTWVGYHRFEPIATPLSMAADLLTFTKEYMDDDDINTDEAIELTANLVYMVKSNITSKSFLEGMHTLTGMIVDPNVSVQRGLIETIARPMTPAIMAQVAKMMDGYDRQTTDTWDRLQARIPIFREQLPKKFGVYGDAKTMDFSTALTSLPIFDATNMSPVQQEMMRVKWDKGGIQDNFKGVKLSRDQLGQLRQLNAELLTPYLESIINSPAYQASSDSMKRKRLDSLARKTRKAIGTQFAYELRKTDPEFAKKFLSAYYVRMGLEDDMPDSLRD